MSHYPMTTLQNIKDIAECFTGCRVHSHTGRVAVVIAPDVDQADGVSTMLKRNAIANRVIKANFHNHYYITVHYG